MIGLIEGGQRVNLHLELIALSQRDRDFVDNNPALYPLTGRADSATQVTSRLADQVKLHLLRS